MFETPIPQILIWLFASTWILTFQSAKADVCDKELGMKTKEIPDERIMASTRLSENHIPAFARLDSLRAWCPAPGDKSPYLQIIFDEEKLVTAVSTQGSSRDLIWAQKYEIEYTNHEGAWVSYNQELAGNRNGQSRQKNFLQPPIITRSVRIYPKEPLVVIPDPTVGAIPCLRLELYGCAAPAPCEDPGVPSNGRRLRSDFGHEKTVTFQCNPKYSLVGNETIRCQDGVWSGHLPQCKAPCEDPGVPSNGSRLGSGLGHEKTVTFRCNLKYSLVGNKRIRCQDGVWSGQLPQCKAPCLDPGVPSNGRRLGSDFGHEKTVTFQCNLKYSLVGNETIRCQDGVWSGHLPQCKASCNSIESPRNGKVHHNETKHGALVLFSCNYGFELQGTRQLKCVEGKWNGTSPTCKATCPRTNFKPNRNCMMSCLSNEDCFHDQKCLCDGDCGLSCVTKKLKCKRPSRGLNLKLVNNGRTFGSETIYFCPVPFTLHGSSKRTCRANGKWDGKKASCSLGDAKCLDMLTGLLQNPPNDTMIDINLHLSLARYRCHKGFKLIGNETRSCRNGKWVETAKPLCKALSLYYSSCGESPVDFRSRIVGGNESQQGWWPWHIGLYHRIGDEFTLQCGGALISPRWVLTAAHCVDKRYPHNLKIIVGDHKLDTLENTQQEIFAKAVHHPDFDFGTYENDIALVKLQNPVELGKFVRTVCLPSQNGGDLAIPGRYGYVTGWGYTRATRPSNTLRYLSMPIQSNSLCRESTSYPYFPRAMFCAGDGKGKKGTCNGDGGGAFVREQRRGNGYRWVATGIDSWGEGCTRKFKYGYYTRVYSYVDWINKTMTEE